MSGRFDAIVVGAGPAGSVAALVLARGGARVALVDRASFPRDKACGDVVGPRGVRLLETLGISVPGAEAGAFELVAPSGRKVALPWPAAGAEYAAGPLVVRRRDLDGALRDAALAAGAVPVRASVRGLDGEAVLTDGASLSAPVVIGADGALSRVAQVAGLVHPAEALWGFALRGYVERDVPRGRIDIFSPPGQRPVPGYGWAFPSSGGGTNVGVGLGLRDRRDRGKLGAGLLADYLRLVWGEAAPELIDRRGGWLRMGLGGVTLARGRVLLVGDAAGLVNPLSGEGIAEAMLSGQTAAEAVLAGPEQAAERYRAAIAARHGRFHSATGAVHAALVARPAAIGRAAELLTTPVLGSALAAGGWMAANDLLDGARIGPARAVAASLAAATAVATASSRRRRVIAARVAGAQAGVAVPAVSAA